MENADYPYWRPEFDKEFKGYEVIYRDKSWRKHEIDTADSYRVFMILCNSRREGESRMDVLNRIKAATEENPIEIGSEIFWTEKR